MKSFTSVYPSARNNSAPNWWISVTFYISLFYENLSRKLQSHYNQPTITGTSHTDRPIYINDHISLKSPYNERVIRKLEEIQTHSLVAINFFFTLSNPIFLPPTHTPALIYFGCERGWWITCNYPTVLKEKNRNGKSKTCAVCWLKSYYMRKSVGNRKIIMSDEVRHWIGKG
jgi:hypothetical protein